MFDGVLADFNSSYAERLIKTTGQDRFPTPRGIPCWDWDLFYGYTKDEIAATWRSITQDRMFWRKLKPLPGVPQVLARLNVLSKTNDVYFITNRMGVECKQQTEKWLYDQGINYPTVLIAGNKRPLIETLGIEFFIDDRLPTMNELALLEKEHFYLLDAEYNREARSNKLNVVTSIGEALEKAGLA